MFWLNVAFLAINDSVWEGFLPWCEQSMSVSNEQGALLGLACVCLQSNERLSESGFHLKFTSTLTQILNENNFYKW